jgi:uncharacterized membrane protein
MQEINADIAILDTHYAAENAIKVLQKSGFDSKKLSIMDNDYRVEEKIVGYYNTGDRMNYWGKLGALCGGVWGALLGPAFFEILGAGPLAEAGPLVSALAGGLQGAFAVGGISLLGAALYSVGIPRDSIVTYETSLKSETFVLVAQGSAEQLTQAKGVLRGMGLALQVQAA